MTLNQDTHHCIDVRQKSERTATPHADPVSTTFRAYFWESFNSHHGFVAIASDEADIRSWRITNTGIFVLVDFWQNSSKQDPERHFVF